MSYYDQLNAEISKIKTGTPSPIRNGKPTEAELYGFSLPLTIILTLVKFVTSQNWTEQERDELKEAAVKIFDEPVPKELPIVSGPVEVGLYQLLRAGFILALDQLLLT